MFEHAYLGEIVRADWFEGEYSGNDSLSIVGEGFFEDPT